PFSNRSGLRRCLDRAGITVESRAPKKWRRASLKAILFGLAVGQGAGLAGGRGLTVRLAASSTPDRLARQTAISRSGRIETASPTHWPLRDHWTRPAQSPATDGALRRRSWTSRATAECHYTRLHPQLNPSKRAWKVRKCENPGIFRGIQVQNCL